MSSLSSASTRQQVLDAIVDNASYLEDNSVAKCKAYITALRIWLRRFAFEESRSGGESLRYNTSNSERDLRDAITWLSNNGGSSGAGNYGGTKQLSVDCFRD
jgi:hypothetical protein